MRSFLLCAFIFVLLSLTGFATDSGKDQRFATIDAILNSAIGKGEIPGAVLLIGHDGEVVYRQAYGYRSLEPRPAPMTLDTIFDVASLTKVVATAPSVMRMLSLGEFRLNDPVAHYLPEFGQNGKQDVTIRQLLTHFSGLQPDLNLSIPWQGEDTAFQMAMAEPLHTPPGAEYVYSDINFEVLGFLVKKISGMTLDKYAEAHIFLPLKMEHTRFNPPGDWLPKIAPTQYDEHNIMLHGVVHDPTARRMGGVAGHAGLFSTADDLARYAQALLDGDKILNPEIIEKMTTPQQPANSTVLEGLGWEIDSPFSTNRGELLPVGSYGHTGFTGTSLWIDPYTKTYIILLSNAVHPRGKGYAIISLRTEIATAAAEALHLKLTKNDNAKLAAITGYNETLAGARRLEDRNGQVMTGIDVLAAQNFQPLRDLSKDGGAVKLGVLTNQNGVDANGRRTIDLLASAQGLQLMAIFSPEHGSTGTLETEHMGNSVDAATHVPIYAVYGVTDAQRRPPPDIVKSLDALVVDLQNAGARYYTFETAMGFFLEAAAQAGKPIFILDRPDPINGAVVQGPLAEPQLLNYVNYHPRPVRHGMTMGELARLFNEERNIHADLRVISMQGWQRGDWYDATNLPWINPSPNLRSLNEATLYPGVGIVEGTNVSVGRGTETPFELLGAPWIKSRELADYLNRRQIAGVRFVPVSFIPTAPPYANQLCNGVNLIVTNRNQLDSPEMGIEIAAGLLRLYPNDYTIANIIGNLANQQVVTALLNGEDPRRIEEDWRDQLEAFEKLRAKYLLYP